MMRRAWLSPGLLLAAPVLFFAAFFLAPLAVGSEVRQDGQPIGVIVSSAGGAALAILPRERTPGPLQTQEGEPLRERPLADGLAR